LIVFYKTILLLGRGRSGEREEVQSEKHSQRPVSQSDMVVLVLEDAEVWLWSNERRKQKTAPEAFVSRWCGGEGSTEKSDQPPDNYRALPITLSPIMSVRRSKPTPAKNFLCICNYFL
jgi:hypothetical protein